MKHISDEIARRVDRADLLRQLNNHEKRASELRSELGLVLREKFETVSLDQIPVDGITRMRTDQVTKLHDQRKLSTEQYDAAVKFRRVWEAMSRGLFPGAASLDGMANTSGRGRFRHPLERMTNRDLWIWFKEYKPFATGPAARNVIDIKVGGRSRFRCTGLQICYSVIIDNYGPSQLEAKWPVAKGKSIVMRALRGVLSQWVHLEYDPDEDLERERDKIIAVAKAGVTDSLGR